MKNGEGNILFCIKMCNGDEGASIFYDIQDRICFWKSVILFP
jgi:hypothetical protein